MKKKRYTECLTNNSSVYKKVRRFGQDVCIICPPFKGENSGLKGRKQKEDKYKNKSRETLRDGGKTIEKIRRQLSPEQF